MTLSPEAPPAFDGVVVASFKSSDEAARAGSALAAGGIAARVHPRNDHYERLCLDAFRGGHDVVVQRDESLRAIALVQALWPDPESRPGAVPCRACGSTNVAVLPRLMIFILLAAIFLAGNLLTGERDLFLLLTAIVAALLASAPKYRCRACGERFRR